jgi:DNA-binding transcriptional regulator YiaG
MRNHGRPDVARRRRVWLLAPGGFRALRHSCFLSRQGAADYLGVCVRTIRHWDAGRCRV